MFHNRLIVILHDLLMIPIAWLGAYWLRFNLETVPPPFEDAAIAVLPWLIFFQALVYQYFGLYRGIWRFASIPDLVRIIKAVIVGTAGIAVAVFFVFPTLLIPRSIFPLYILLLTTLLGGSRLTLRILKDWGGLFKTQKRVLIVGAGSAADGIIRDLLRDKQQSYHPLVLVDDHPKQQGREIHGVRVQGFYKDIPKLTKKYKIDLIVIAVPSASSATLRTIVDYCEKTEIPFQILPDVIDLATGKVSIQAMRPVALEDLLGREPVNLDWAAITAGLTQKTILVTGGGGSIGSELCRQIVRLKPAALIIIENNEFNLYNLEQELQKQAPDIPAHFHLADILDKPTVHHLLQQYRPDIIFHAAAYKHVPILETHVRMAVRNNILGTRIMAEAASQHGVKTFVLISTDKAVNPGNILGMTKRIAEIFCQNFNDHNKSTRFVTVRFGNVLGSAGSVVPLFRKQLENGGPLTVTHPDITRFFMTIPEACQLILQATVLAKGGEIFVLDMGEPVKIQYLAEQMIRLSGKEIEIQYTGLRPGEKLHEELFYSHEPWTSTSHPKILHAPYSQQPWELFLASLDVVVQTSDTPEKEILLRDQLTKLLPQ